jgi:transcriptional regulator of heat shock response
MAYKQSTMQPTIVQLQESKALASTCSMSNRSYEVGWDVEHLLNVISEILGALVVVLLHGPSSIRLSFLQRVLIRSTLTLTQLPRYSDKQKSNQTTKPRKIAEGEAQGIERQLHQKTQKGRMT